MSKVIEMENPKQKRCPKCGRRRLRKLLGEQTGKFVGYQCKSKSCYHWWCPNEGKPSLKETIKVLLHMPDLPVLEVAKNVD